MSNVTCHISDVTCHVSLWNKFQLSFMERKQPRNRLISNLERENEADEVVVKKVVGTHVESTLEVDPGHLADAGEGVGKKCNYIGSTYLKLSR